MPLWITGEAEEKEGILPIKVFAGVTKGVRLWTLIQVDIYNELRISALFVHLFHCERSAAIS